MTTAERLLLAQAALHRYGQHHANCLALTKQIRRHRYCTCGLMLARHVADPNNPRFRDCKQCQVPGVFPRRFSLVQKLLAIATAILAQYVDAYPRD